MNDKSKRIIDRLYTEGINRQDSAKAASMRPTRRTTAAPSGAKA